ncbi:alternate-type signal peptide domain-containing protein [Nocardioides euryhalodurans]|uniref:Alternate-type signal peptide domain-containing protein n=1 Tax=Nocardioides euryhalodurans TaxID=2518370 RepID=A0A4V1BDL7_9ACTN|nr:alternate-type signal peptide domain-containing protein [Nocardioides euryhalodurans]QBR91562.1 alternate-type signal peptide domain-containing protein [Nocardioides euryhalodurans]
MQKTVKGAVAGASGVALLVGGFGTYALWTDSEGLATHGVQSGRLDIASTPGVYDDANTAAADDWAATDKLVPGDKVTYSQTFTVTAEGKNLEGTIAYQQPSLASSFSAGLAHSVEVVANGATVYETSPGSNQFTFHEPFGSITFTAVVTYELPAATAGSADQGRSATLPAADITITQG